MLFQNKEIPNGVENVLLSNMMAISDTNSADQSTDRIFGINGSEQNTVKFANKHFVNIFLFSLIKECRVHVLRHKKEKKCTNPGKRNRSALILALLYSDKCVF